MVISTNQKPTIYRNLYENTGPVPHVGILRYWPSTNTKYCAHWEQTTCVRTVISFWPSLVVSVSQRWDFIATWWPSWVSRGDIMFLVTSARTVTCPNQLNFQTLDCYSDGDGGGGAPMNMMHTVVKQWSWILSGNLMRMARWMKWHCPPFRHRIWNSSPGGLSTLPLGHGGLT